MQFRLYRNSDSALSHNARQQLVDKFGYSSMRSLVHDYAGDAAHTSGFGSMVDFTNGISAKLNSPERHLYIIAAAIALFLSLLLVVTARIWCRSKSSWESRKFTAPSRWANTVDLYRTRKGQVRHLVASRGHSATFPHSRCENLRNE